MVVLVLQGFFLLYLPREGEKAMPASAFDYTDNRRVEALSMSLLRALLDNLSKEEALRCIEDQNGFCEAVRQFARQGMKNSSAGRVAHGEVLPLQREEETKRVHIGLPSSCSTRNRLMFSLQGSGRTGEEWITFFEQKGVGVTKEASDVLLGEDFNTNHRLGSGEYRMAIVYGNEILDDRKRTTSGIHVRAIKELGRTVVDPIKAELVLSFYAQFALREILASKMAGLRVLHTPILSTDGPVELWFISHGGGKMTLDTTMFDPEEEFDVHSLFAFPY
jgi:hypothetical protein